MTDPDCKKCFVQNFRVSVDGVIVQSALGQPAAQTKNVSKLQETKRYVRA